MSYSPAGANELTGFLSAPVDDADQRVSLILPSGQSNCLQPIGSFFFLFSQWLLFTFLCF